MKARDKVHDFEGGSLYAPTPPVLQDNLSEATGPAIFDLRKAPATREAVEAILDTVPRHLWGAVMESASSRNIVPREVVAIMIEVIGVNQLVAMLGTRMTGSIAFRFLPEGHPLLGK